MYVCVWSICMLLSNISIMNPYKTIFIEGRCNEQQIFLKLKRIVTSSTKLMIFSPIQEAYSSMITHFRSMGVEVLYFTHFDELEPIVKSMFTRTSEDTPPTCFVFDMYENLQIKPTFDWLLRCNRTLRSNVIVSARFRKDLSLRAQESIDVYCISNTP